MLPLATFAASAAVGVGKSIAGAVASSLTKTSQADSTLPATTAQAKAKKTATDFEAMFLEQSMDRLTASEGTDGPLGENGSGGGVYRSMLSKEYAGQIVKSGGVGIANQVYSEMLKMQEGSNAGRA